MIFTDKYSRYIPLCLAAAAPALVSGTSSLPPALACAAVILLSGVSALLAAMCTAKSTVPSLSPFAVIMISAAVSVGCELIISALFPLSFPNSISLPLAGSALFFSACFGTSFKGSVSGGLCHTAAAALSVLLCALLRLVFSFLPLSGDISMGFIFAGITAAAVQYFCLPECGKSPEAGLLRSVRSAFFASLALACAFLFSDGARMLSYSLWGETVSVLLCVLSAFLTSRAALRIFLPDEQSVFLPAAVAVLVLIQPASEGPGEAVLRSMGTAAIAVVFLTALSPAVHRIRLSEAPRCIRGLPCILIISGLCALAFSGLR